MAIILAIHFFFLLATPRWRVPKRTKELLRLHLLTFSELLFILVHWQVDFHVVCQPFILFFLFLNDSQNLSALVNFNLFWFLNKENNKILTKISYDPILLRNACFNLSEPKKILKHRSSLKNSLLLLCFLLTLISLFYYSSKNLAEIIFKRKTNKYIWLIYPLFKSLIKVPLSRQLVVYFDLLVNYW